jgi:hypothetical protein
MTSTHADSGRRHPAALAKRILKLVPRSRPARRIPVIVMPGTPVIARRVLAPATGMPALGAVIFEVVFVVGPQESHTGQDDDHNQGNYGCQNDQHRLVHRTIHRGLGLRTALAAFVPAIGTSTPVTSSALGSFRINR